MSRSLKFLLLILLASQSLFAVWDLGLAWIEREEKYPNPKDADGSWNRPKPGDTVNWTAHIYSNSEDQSGSVNAVISWFVNTKRELVTTQAISKAVGLYESKYAWKVPENYTYDFTRPLTNMMKVTMRYVGGATDNNTSNNTREFYLDAMTFCVKVYTNTFFKYTSSARPPKSFYDNLEDTIKFTNGRYEAMKYPTSPYGVIDRYRVDHVELMNVPKDPTRFEGNENYYTTVSFSEGDDYGGYLGNPYDWIGQTFLWSGQGVFSTMGHGALCHETGHSLCLPDTYRFGMSASKNKVSGQAYTSDWGDPNGKEDMMRYCYNGAKDVFTELGAYCINLHAGEQRRYPPEMHKGKKGWMFALLPTNICIKIYGEKGHEISDVEIPFWRGTGNAYEMAFENTNASYVVTYKSGAKITPAYSYDNNNLYANCFMVKVPGSGSSWYKIIDSLYLNYKHIKGQAETAIYSYTNTALKVAEPTSVVVGDGSGKVQSPETQLHLAYPANAVKVRWAYSEGALDNAEWLDIANDVDILLTASGTQTLYIQVLSSDGVLSDTYKRTVTLGDGFDFGLVWLERTPKYGIGKYDIGSRYRPEPGDNLTWTANIYCNTSETNDPVSIITDWYVNTKRLASHTNSYAAIRGMYTDDFKWTMPNSYVYDFEHPLTNIIKAVLRYPGGITDNNPSNDVLEVYMDALTFGVTVVDATFDKYTTKTKSFYDHMNDTINYMNAQFGRGKTKMAPYGIIDRYRVAYLKRQKSQSTSINPPSSTNCTTQLFFNEGGSMGAFYNAPYYWIGQTFSSGIFNMAGHGALCHEAGHSLQLPDTYRFDLSADNNKVNGKSWHCNWMDPPNKQDIMRYCYEGWDDVFCGVDPFMANLQAGVYRRTPPEMYSNAYCNSKGWMFEYLPSNVCMRIYNTDGRELDQIPVTMHRGGGSSYYIEFPNTKYEWWRTYEKGGLTFATTPICNNARMFENCYMLTMRCTGLPFDVLDVLRLDYLSAMQKTKNTVIFSYTNDFATSEITQMTVNNGDPETISRSVKLELQTDNATRKTRYAYSLEALETNSWEDSFTEKIIVLPPDEGTYTVYAQVLSRSFVPSYPVSKEITLVPEPAIWTAALAALLLASRKKTTA